MTLKDPLHKLKRIKPKIHLFRDDAILELFREIYEIIDCYVKENEDSKKEFLFIPISGMHLGGHTTEHFFLKGAPIGIFNMPEKESRVRSISGILAYSLFNRKVDLSATKELNELEVDSPEKHIVSFGAIKTPDNVTPIIQKNFKIYKKDILGPVKLIDPFIWNEIFEKIKVTVNELHNEKTIFIIPEFEELINRLPFFLFEDDTISKIVFYVSENIIELGKRSGLNFNYYFPSLHFAMGENNDHSYGFMVVSSNQDLNPENKDSNPEIEVNTSELIKFLERLSLITFSLVGIIEQHHYGKIERFNAKIQLIDKLPEYLLNQSALFQNEADWKLFREINDKFQYNPLKKAAGIILKSLQFEIRSEEDIIEYSNKKGKAQDLFIWNNDKEKNLNDLIMDLKEQRFCYRYNDLLKVIDSKPNLCQHPLRHSFLNYESFEDKDIFWQVYKDAIFPFMDLLDEKIHYQFSETIFKGVLNAINTKTMRKNYYNDEHDLEFYMRKLNDDGIKICRDAENFDFSTYLNWKISKTDYKNIQGTILANIRSSDIPMKNLQTFENEKWLILFQQTDTEPLTEEFKERITQKLLSTNYVSEKINTLKAIINDYYFGELLWLSMKESKVEYVLTKELDFNKLINRPEEIIAKKGQVGNGTYYFIYLPKDI